MKTSLLICVLGSLLTLTGCSSDRPMSTTTTTEETTVSHPVSTTTTETTVH